MGFIPYAKPYNSLIFALASRKDYAEKALEIWRKMRYMQIVPNVETFQAVIKATSQLGDVQTAYEAIQEMKGYEIPLNEAIYNQLILTYAGACKVQETTEKQIDAYIKDAWMLFRQMEEKRMKVTTRTLNALIRLYGNALRDTEVEGEVLPLFKKNKIEYDRDTYVNLMGRLFNHM